MSHNHILDIFKVLKLRTKLYILAFISIFGLALLSSLLIFSLNTLQLLNEGSTEIKELHTDLLTLRRNEKDFLQRGYPKYITQFQQTMIYIQQDTQRLNEILKELHIDNSKIEELILIVQTYEQLFLKFSSKEELLQLKYDEGIHQQMRQAAHKAEDTIDTINLTIAIELNHKVTNLKYMVYGFFILISLLILAVSMFIIKNIVYNFQKKVDEQTEALEENIKKLKSAQSELIQSEKMASLGSLVAGVSHEINTPIGIALTASTHTKKELDTLQKSYLDQAMSEQEFLDYIDDTKLANAAIHKNLTRAVNLIRSFKQVAVDQMSDEKREFYLKEYIDEILLSIHNKIKKTKISFDIDIDKNISLYSNAGAFSQIFTNLILNSIIHGFENGTKEGIIKISASLDEENIKIIYEDNGKGLDETTQKKIFDPFYTTNRANGGSGLGMNIVYNLVTQKLNGSIAIENRKEKGVAFIIECKTTL